MSPNPGLEVKLTRDEYHDWAIARRDRDFLSSRNRPKTPKDGEKPKPYADKQLDKSLAVLTDKLPK